MIKIDDHSLTGSCSLEKSLDNPVHGAHPKTGAPIERGGDSFQFVDEEFVEMQLRVM
jgi:hypothetical protein